MSYDEYFNLKISSELIKLLSCNEVCKSKIRKDDLKFLSFRDVFIKLRNQLNCFHFVVCDLFVIANEIKAESSLVGNI